MHFADAEDAIREFHGTRLEGDRIIVRHHSYSSDSISNHHLIMSRLNSQRVDVVTKTVETIVLVNVATTAVKLVSG